MGKINKKVGPLLENVPLDKLILTNRFEYESERLVSVLIYVSSWVDSIILDVTKPYDITRPQYNLLNILCNNYPAKLPMGTITARMVDKNSNVTRLADRLIERGLVIREQNEQNRRIHELIVTPKGQKLFEDIREGLHKNLWSLIEERLQEEELKKLVYLLVKMKGIV